MSPGKLAAMLKLNPLALVMLVGRNVTWQLADDELAGLREHVVGLNVPVPPGELGVVAQLTLPVGTTFIPPLVSVIVTSQTVTAPTTCGFG